MRLRDPKDPKCSDRLVDEVFELMFETLWLAPYDRRRRNTVYAQYEVCVRHAAQALTVVDLATMDAVQLQSISQTIHALADCVRQLSMEEIFAPERCRAAMKAIERILQATHEKIAVR